MQQPYAFVKATISSLPSPERTCDGNLPWRVQDAVAPDRGTDRGSHSYNVGVSMSSFPRKDLQLMYFFIFFAHKLVLFPVPCGGLARRADRGSLIRAHQPPHATGRAYRQTGRLSSPKSDQ
jgi:hypothetical protein